MTDISRRRILRTGGLILAGTSMISGRAQAAGLPEAPLMDKATMQPPLYPTTGPDYQPVVTLNGWTLPWRMRGDWKEFHLIAEPVVREMAPGMNARLWGYNGQSPGPTIEAVEGDKVRIFVTNRLPEATAVHWHGQTLPNGMDGVAGLNQPGIPPGKTFVYEFILRRSGTFMYHPHSDEMVQMAMGMMGFFIVHPRDPAERRVDRDFVWLLNAYDIEAGAYVPKVNTMLDMNMWCFNSRVWPGIDPVVARQGDKVRMRFGNLTMTNHPIHVHGVDFKVTGTDGGWIDQDRQWPEVSVDVAVGQMRAIEFNADNPGDWAMHCPQVAPHHERHGAFGPHLHRRELETDGQADPEDRAGVHADGFDRRRHDDRDGDAASREHAADDDGRGSVRVGGDGRHVHRPQGPPRARSGRLPGPRLVPASGGNPGLRMDRRSDARAQPRAGDREGQARPRDRPPGRRSADAPVRLEFRRPPGSLSPRERDHATTVRNGAIPVRSPPRGSPNPLDGDLRGGSTSHKERHHER